VKNIRNDANLYEASTVLITSKLYVMYLEIATIIEEFYTAFDRINSTLIP